MRVALLVPEKEWRQLLADVQRLKATESATPKPAPSPADRLLPVRQAAAHTNLTPEGIRKARRAGRIKGVQLNEKEWGFYESELNRHLDRYHRKPFDANQWRQPVGQAA
ncbi:MAG: DNA-binding protein [Hymenobacter sp.]|nr:DNA-binding protein [Hymenobacter sp.]